MITIFKKILFLFILLFTILICPVYAFDFYNVQSETGQVSITVEDIEYPYQVEMRYHESSSWFTIYRDVYDDNFTIEFLENGVTYFIRITDADGNNIYKRYTTPFTVIPIQNLQIVEIKDTSATFDWYQYNYAVDIYVNGYLKKSVGKSVTSATLDGLTPGTEYKVHVVFASGLISNVITFKTSTLETNIIAKIDSNMRDLFIPPSTDSNSNGVPDWLDDFLKSLKKLGEFGPLKTAQEIANVISNTSKGDFDADLPKLNVTFAPGLTFNVFDLSELGEQVRLLREIMSAIVWLTFFFYLIKFIVPRFDV